MRVNRDAAPQRAMALFLMGEKGYAVLRALAESYPDLIEHVVGATDKSVQKDYFTEIRDLCREKGIAFHLRGEAPEPTATYAFAISWRWVINASRAQLIVFHDSLLPRYRGYNPLPSALLNMDPVIGVTALVAAAEFDRGDIVGQASSRITYPIKIQRAIELVSENYVELSSDLAAQIARGEELRGEPQDESRATYSIWRDDEDYRIDWSASAAYIARFIDSVGFPYKGASTQVNGVLARIFDAEVLPDVVIENRTPGKVLFMNAGRPTVICGSGLLRITTMVDDESGESLLPLKKYRSRFR